MKNIFTNYETNLHDLIDKIEINLILVELIKSRLILSKIIL